MEVLWAERPLTLIGGIKRGFLQAAKLDSQHVDARWGLIEYYLAIPGFLGGGIKKCQPYADELLDISPVEGYFAQAYLHELKEEHDKCFGKSTTEPIKLSYWKGLFRI